MTGPVREGDHLPPTSRLWPDEQAGPWLLTFHWQVVHGRAECVGLDIASSLPPETLKERFASLATLPEVGQPLRTTTLRDLRLAELLHEERIRADHLAVEVLGDDELGEAYAAPKTMRPATERRLRLVADVYRNARASGLSPNKAVAEKLKVSPGAAANLVMRAREAGFLLTPSQIRAQERAAIMRLPSAGERYAALEANRRRHAGEPDPMP